MRTIAYTGASSETLHRVLRAIPRGLLRAVSLDSVDDLAREGEIHALILDRTALAPRALAWLAVLKSRQPDLLVLACLPADDDWGKRAFGLARAGVDELLVAGVEDHPAHVREALRRAQVRTVARVVERWGAPFPASLASPDLERTLGRISLLKTATALAQSLGIPETRLDRELHDADLFKPRTLLGHLRLLRGARVLGDCDESLERIAMEELDYASLSSFGNACRRLWGVSPYEIRGGGGLRFGAERFRIAVRGYREPNAVLETRQVAHSSARRDMALLQGRHPGSFLNRRSASQASR